MKKTPLFAGLAVVAAAGLVGALWWAPSSDLPEDTAFTAPGLDPMTFDEAGAQFWKLTPAELRLMLGEPGTSGPLLSSGLQALMDAWPDEEKKDGTDDG